MTKVLHKHRSRRQQQTKSKSVVETAPPIHVVVVMSTHFVTFRTVLISPSIICNMKFFDTESLYVSREIFHNCAKRSL